jgi:hypothetical protein
MIGHDAALRLAGAAFDFELTAVERAALEAHLATCAACAAEAHDLRAQAGLLAALPAAPLLDPRRGEAILARALAPERGLVAHPLRLALVAALVALLALGSILVGGTLLQRARENLSVIVPVPRPAVFDPSPHPSAVASEKPEAGLVAYTIVTCPPGWTNDPSRASECTTTSWLAAADGSGARELPGTPMGWSADGSRLLVVGDAGPILLDATGSEIRAFTTWCADKPPSAQGSCAAEPQALCTYPCAGADGFALSPDGTRVAFVRSSPDTQNATVVAILDLATGRAAELASTRTTNPPVPVQCNKVQTCQGMDDTPRWSPDGRRIVFARQTMSPDASSATWTSAGLWVVDADGANLRRVTPTGLYAFDPSWSPDGTRLVFTNTEFIVNAERTSVLSMRADIYTINVGATGLTRLTDDGLSARPDWTSTGRLAFMRQLVPTPGGGDAQGFENRVMDADGSNQLGPDGSLAELTAAGCTTCVYPSSASSAPIGPYRAYWQPIP